MYTVVRKLGNAYKMRAFVVQTPVRFVLGSPEAPKVELTSQDVFGTAPKSKAQAFGQKDAINLKQADGPYKVRITRDGKYSFKLSRYPLDTGVTRKEWESRLFPLREMLER